LRFEGRTRIRTQLDVAPLVDVVFLLLIFFLLTSSYVAPRAIDLVLPSSSTADLSEDRPYIVSLARDGTIRFQDAQVTLERLKDRIGDELKSAGERSMILEADGKAPVQRIVRILDAIREAGATSVALATTASRGDTRER